MAKHKFYLDRKITIWERDSFEIEAETIEEAIAIVIEATKDIYDGQLEFEGETTPLYETSDFIEAKENQAATVEIYKESGEQIWSNWEDY